MTITNGKAFPGTSINVNDNITNIAVGDKLLIDTGIISTIILGSWNRLVAGPGTVIQLGTKMTATLANAVSVTKGSSWHYSSQRNTISDTDIQSAFHHFEIGGGISNNQQQQRITEDKQVRLLLFTIVTFFLFTVGISLVDIQLTTFKKNGENGNENTTNNPSTGEIINVDGTGIEFNPKAVYSLIFEGLSLLILMLGQWLLARKMANKSTSTKTVSKLILDNHSIKTKVFSKPDDPEHSNYAHIAINNQSTEESSQSSGENSISLN